MEIFFLGLFRICHGNPQADSTWLFRGHHNHPSTSVLPSSIAGGGFSVCSSSRRNTASFVDFDNMASAAATPDGDGLVIVKVKEDLADVTEVTELAA